VKLERLIPMLLLLTAAVVAGFFFSARNAPAPEAPVAENDAMSAVEPAESADVSPEADIQTQVDAAQDAAQQAAAEAEAAAQAAREAQAEVERQAAQEAQRQADEAQARQTAADKPNWRVVKDSDIPEQPDVLLGSTDPRQGKDPAYSMTMVLTDHGASVARAQLNDFFVTVADKQLYDRDPAAYDEARLADPDKYRGRYPLLESIKLGDRELPALAIRSVWLAMREEEGWREVEVDLSGRRWEQVGEKVVGEGFEAVTYRFVIYYGLEASASTAVLQIDKTYRLDMDSYSLTMSVELTNLSEKPIRVAYDQTGPAGLGTEDSRMDDRRTAVGRAKPGNKDLEVRLEEPKVLAKMEPSEWRSFGNTHDPEAPAWVGTTNKYFATLMWLVPGEEADNDGPSRQFDNAISMAAELWWAGVYLQKGMRYGDQAALTGMQVGKQVYSAGPMGVELAAGDSKTSTFSIYAGPKDRGIFDDAGNRFFRPAYKPLAFRSTIDFGGCWCNIPPLTFFMMWGLGMLASLTGGNYGVAIIVLVILVRVLLHPLTKKSQISMLKMQKLQPEIKKLQAKYADDKATLNQEMMRMYKEHGANPMLGCLPMLLQLPILIALFTGINATVQLRHAAFLPVWITDMAAPDALITWSQPLPLIGNTFNLLPVLLAVAMFFQTKMNPSMNQSAASSSSDAMQQQQKMMKWMMPIMMLLFFYKAPSGLTLYFMASTAAGVVDQMLVRRHIQQADDAANAQVIDVMVDAPGKSARGNRPKKPKPPFKTGM
jgi:YidC/Oxa1 family membrane protein insertase